MPCSKIGNFRVLRRQRPFAHARRVGLHHAHDAVHAMRRHARAGAGAARRGVGRRDERIRAVVNVEKRPLRAFEQNVVAAPHRLVQQHDGVGDERFQIIPGGAVFGENLLERERFRAERLQHFVVFLDARTASFSSNRSGLIRSIMRRPTRAALSP